MKQKTNEAIDEAKNIYNVSRWALEIIAKANQEKEKEEIKATVDKLNETLRGRQVIIEDCCISSHFPID